MPSKSNTSKKPRNESRAGPAALSVLCPHCGEMKATDNPRNNLAHCFGCGQNLNNIDLLIQLGYNFRSAARLLEQWLLRYQTQIAKKNNPTPLTARQ